MHVPIYLYNLLCYTSLCEAAPGTALVVEVALYHLHLPPLLLQPHHVLGANGEGPNQSQLASRAKTQPKQPLRIRGCQHSKQSTGSMLADRNLKMVLACPEREAWEGERRIMGFFLKKLLNPPGFCYAFLSWGALSVRVPPLASSGDLFLPGAVPPLAVSPPVVPLTPGAAASFS